MEVIIKASDHPRQAARLRELRSFDILDTEREGDFDDVVKLASEICGTAISVVNLIDEDRQWFKAEVGLGVRETPLDTSICAHVILTDDFVEIPDTHSDPRLADNPLVKADPGLRFYAGVRLVANDGLPIGTLCVLDFVPRKLTALQSETLRVLGHQVMAQLNLRRALKQADILRREVDHRVKNSLQALSSMIRMQVRRATTDVAAALSEIDQRIQTVAMLHEQLYKTDAGDAIDLSAYVDNLTRYLTSFAPAGVTVTGTAAAVVAGSQQAALIGTLINEFATNAFKHAFVGRDGGTVKVDLTTQSDGTVRLLLSDNGIGLPPAAQTAGRGLGMMILNAVGQQLGGTVALTSDDTGVQLALSFQPA